MSFERLRCPSQGNFWKRETLTVHISLSSWTPVVWSRMKDKDGGDEVSFVTIVVSCSFLTLHVPRLHTRRVEQTENDRVVTKEKISVIEQSVMFAVDVLFPYYGRNHSQTGH